ncbi:MAG: hypothetical protein ACXAC7_09915 [Candidatus Hodarchaeales archaeon]|jgi:hypothetical protein
MVYETVEETLNKEYYAIQGLFEGRWFVLSKFKNELDAMAKIKELIDEAAKKNQRFDQKRIVFIRELKEFRSKVDSDNLLDMF